jgi:DNA-binding beta-propeller fold protein YncE
VGQDPVGVAAAGNYVWVVNAGDQTVSMINTQVADVRSVPIPIHAQVGPIASTGDDPLGEAWMPSGTILLSLTPKS